MSKKLHKCGFQKTALGAAISSLFAGGAVAESLGENSSQATPALEEVVVVGVRRSLEHANSLKRNADSIQDSIVAEDIGKFPDQNVAESLQRITGVSISRTNGVGTAITVRGFGPKFNIVRVNGRTLATTDIGREFDFQVLPSELIIGADVVKAPTASTPDGSLGAFVNVRTAKPLSNPGLNVVASVGSRYDDMSDAFDPKASGLISNTWADETFGTLFAFSYEETDSLIDVHTLNRWGEVSNKWPDALQGTIQFEDGQDVPEGFQFSRPGRIIYAQDEEKRERIGLNGVLQFAPSDTFVTTIDAMYMDLSRQSLSLGFQIPAQASQYANVVVDEHGTMASATIHNNNIDALFREIGQDSDSLAFGLNNVWNSGRFELETDISYSRAKADPQFNELVPHYSLPGYPDSPGAEYAATGQRIDMVAHAGGAGDIISFDTNIDVNDPGSVRSHWNEFHHNDVQDEILEFKVDGTFEMGDGLFESVQGGIAYQNREKENEAYKQAETPVYHGCSPCGGTIDLPDSLFVQDGVTGYMRNEDGNFPRRFTTVTSAQDYVDAVQQIRNMLMLGGNDPWNLEFHDPAASYLNEEKTLSAYIRANFRGSNNQFDWFANVGARYVKTDAKSVGFGETLEYVFLTSESSETEIRAGGVFSAPTSLEAENDYSHVLPSLNVTLDFNNGFFARFGAAKVITKPAIEFLGVSQNVHVPESEAVVQRQGGNPFLRPYEATQFDVSLEYYDGSNAYGLMFFHKDIKSFISTITTVQPLDSSVRVDPAIIERIGSINEVVNTNENRKGGTVTGFEASVLHYFDNLPEPFNGLGVQANYTYVNNNDPDAEPIDIPNVDDPGSVLEGLAPHSYNLVGFYEKGRIQGRVAYNWRDTFLSARQGFLSRGWPEHDYKYGQLDLSVSFDLTDSIKLTGEVINLTDEGRLEFADQRSRITNLEYSGRRYSLSLRAVL